jgi:hypothetical protein
VVDGRCLTALCVIEKQRNVRKRVRDSPDFRFGLRRLDEQGVGTSLPIPSRVPAQRRGPPSPRVRAGDDEEIVMRSLSSGRASF